MTNVAGAGGAVGLPQFVNQWKARPNALMVAGMVMVGAILTNKSPINLTQVTPIARLTGECRGACGAGRIAASRRSQTSSRR